MRVAYYGLRSKGRFLETRLNKFHNLTSGQFLQGADLKVLLVYARKESRVFNGASEKLVMTNWSICLRETNPHYQTLYSKELY